MKKEIAIIGYGRFGRTAAHHLKKRYRVVVADVRRIPRPEAGVRSIPIEEAAGKKVVILSVPIRRLMSVLQKISPFLTPGALVCDVSSVKDEPTRWMKNVLPSTVEIMGTHPLFGPDSAMVSLRDRTIVLCPVRITRARATHVRSTLKQLGLNVISMQPQEHDRLMASTLFLTQLVGRSLVGLNLPHTGCSTQHFRFLQQLVQTAKNDSTTLFQDMFRYNRFAKTIPTRVLTSFRKTVQSLTA